MSVFCYLKGDDDSSFGEDGGFGDNMRMVISLFGVRR